MTRTDRYARQLLVPEVGLDGQERLRGARVLIVGLGGLGCPAATYLTTSGIGHLTLVDPDRVELSNLHRQPLYGDADIGRLKVESARARLQSLNPDVSVRTVPERLATGNAEHLVRDHDVVLDGTDNLETRYLLSDVCEATDTPLVYGSLSQFQGQVSVFCYERGPSYRDLFPSTAGIAPLNCAEAGVLGVLPGVIGTLQAVEVLKIVLGAGDVLSGRLLLYDALAARFRILHFGRDPDRGVEPGPSKQAEPRSLAEPDETLSADRVLAAPERYALLDVREDSERAAGHIGGLHVPLSQVPDEIDRIRSHANSRTLVVYCASGQRSLQAVRYLQRQEVTATSLEGGLAGWPTAAPDER